MKDSGIFSQQFMNVVDNHLLKATHLIEDIVY